MQKILSLQQKTSPKSLINSLLNVVLALLFFDFIQIVNGSSEAGSCAAVTSSILLLKPENSKFCLATLYNKDTSNLDVSFWITASECCDTPPLTLNNDGEEITFNIDHIGPFLCLGHTLPVPIHGYDISETTSFAPQTEFQLGTLRNTFKQLYNPHWFDTSKELFGLNDLNGREKSGTPVFVENQLVGILTKSFMKKPYFAGIQDNALTQTLLPSPTRISFSTGFNSSFYDFEENPLVLKASRYLFNNSIGTQVFYYDYKQFSNNTITIGLSRELFSNNASVERINVVDNGTCYHSDQHISILSDGTRQKPKRNHIWCEGGVESYMFQHQSPILRLKTPEGNCEAFKIDDPQINYPNRDHFVTAGHCVSPNNPKSLLISESKKELNATLFSREYFESDWAILVTAPTDGPGFSLLAENTILAQNSVITHKRLGDIATTHRVGKFGINLSQPLFGIKGLEALLGSSGSPLLTNKGVFGIQSWTFDTMSMLASQIPPISAFKKAINRQWEALDLPINKFAYFDNGGFLNLTGFSIRGSIRQAEFRTYFNGEQTLFSKNWKRFNYEKMQASEHIVTTPNIYKRYLQFQSWQNQTLDKAKYCFEKFEGYNLTLQNYIETDKCQNASRQVIKFDDGRIMDNVIQSKNKITDTLTFGFTQEKRSDNTYLYFKNIEQTGDEIKKWEASSAQEFDNALDRALGK